MLMAMAMQIFMPLAAAAAVSLAVPPALPAVPYVHPGIIVSLPMLQKIRSDVQARPSPIPSPCTHFTHAWIEWRRCHRAACMARSYQEHHRSVRAEL